MFTRRVQMKLNCWSLEIACVLMLFWEDEASGESVPTGSLTAGVPGKSVAVETSVCGGRFVR